MRNRFNAENPLVLNFDFTLTREAENAFYYLANLMYRDYTEDEVKDIFSDAKALADELSDMLSELVSDDSEDFKNAVITVSCVLLKQFSK